MNPSDIKKMERVCRHAAETLQMAEKLVRPGVSTQEINDIIHEHTLSIGCLSAPLNYHGFPKSICTSVNDVVCHGVPSPDEILMPGDVINVDVTLIKDGFHGDTSRTFIVGATSKENEELIKAAQDAMYAGIAEVKAGKPLLNVAKAQNNLVKSRGFHVVREIGGHGIGKKFHMDPFVPAHPSADIGKRMFSNTCLTVEPMVNMLSHEYMPIKVPGSSIEFYRTVDGKPSAQFEHTVLVTKAGPVILTEW